MAQDTSTSGDAHSTGPLSRQVTGARDRSASERVSAGLSTAQGKELPPLEELRAALVVGEASGEAGPFDLDAFVASKRS